MRASSLRPIRVRSGLRPGRVAGLLAVAVVRLLATGEHAGAQEGVALDLAFLGASLSWAAPVGEGRALGLAVGGGHAGVTLMGGELSDRRSGGPPGLVAEVVHGAVFLRHRTPDGRVDLEWGPRVAWTYHPATEYESVFVGLYGGLAVGAGPVSLGARATFGRYLEEAGRRELNLALVPLVLRLRLPRAGGLP